VPADSLAGKPIVHRLEGASWLLYSIGEVWTWELDQRNDELVGFAENGIFRISVDRA
jgi:hypothetical protein